MSEQEKPDAVERLVSAYETMLERINERMQASKESVPRIRQALEQARESAVELGELTREEAEKVSQYIERDIKDAAEYISDTGQEFREWLSFDWQLIETQLFDMFANVADQTSLQLREWAESARRASLYHTGEVTGPGSLVCVQCGEVLHFEKAGHIPPCPKCRASEFRRGTGPQDGDGDGADGGEGGGD